MALINLRTFLFVAALVTVAIAAGAYSEWMKEHYGCTPCTLGGCAVGVVVAFLVMAVHNLKGGPLETALFLLLALAITLLLYAGNQRKCGSSFHGAMMTLWQLVIGGLAFCFLCCLLVMNGSKKKR